MMDIENQTSVLPIHPRRALLALTVAGIIVILLSLLGVHIKFFPGAYHVHTNNQANFLQDFTIEMDFNLEHNISAYFGTLVLALAAYLLFVITTAKKGEAGRLPWAAMAWTIFFLSMNSLAEIMDKVNAYFQDGSTPPRSQIVAAVIFFLILIPLWRQLGSPSSWLFLAFGLLYFSAAFAKEYTFAYAGKDLPYALYTVAEQALEYGAEIILVYGLLLYFESAMPQVSISIIDTAPAKM